MWTVHFAGQYYIKLAYLPDNDINKAAPTTINWIYPIICLAEPKDEH